MAATDRGVSLRKWLEQTRQHIRWNTDPRVGHLATQRDGTSSVGSFSDFLSAASTEGSSAASEAADVAATAGLTNLLALQEISEEERKRERLVKQGKNMLESLEKLRQQLLIGEIPAHMLNELSTSLAEQKEATADPHLMLLIEDIELRVAVELAKLEMSFASQAEI